MSEAKVLMTGPKGANKKNHAGSKTRVATDREKDTYAASA